MSDSNDNHGCRYTTQELTKEESEDPGPRRLSLAACDVNGQRSIRA